MSSAGHARWWSAVAINVAASDRTAGACNTRFFAEFQADRHAVRRMPANAVLKATPECLIHDAVVVRCDSQARDKAASIDDRVGSVNQPHLPLDVGDRVVVPENGRLVAVVAHSRFE